MDQGVTHKRDVSVRKALYFFLRVADSSYMTTMILKIEEMSGTLKLAATIAYAMVWCMICFGRM